jgi:DNA-binding response OmpR family regulator
LLKHQPTATAKGAKMSILIINNDALFLHTLQRVFEVHGHQVITSKTSLTAQNLFLQHRPSVLILDAVMEDKDGFELLKDLRTFCKETLVIAVSSDDRYLRAIKKLGANLVLAKSTEPDLIVNAIHAYFLFFRKETSLSLWQ